MTHTPSDPQIAREVHGLYAELRPLLDSDAQRDLLDSLYRLVYTPPTMADVEWDGAVHAGLCAEHPVYGVVRMIGPDLDNEGTIICHWDYCDAPLTGRLLAENLTPLPGARLDLTPRRESTPDHPKVLTTKEDYRNAPAGTVASTEDEGALTWTKGKDGLWEAYGPGGVLRNCAVSGGARRVLRWGWSS